MDSLDVLPFRKELSRLPFTSILIVYFIFFMIAMLACSLVLLVGLLACSVVFLLETGSCAGSLLLPY